MPKKSSYDLKDAQHLKVPQSIWDKYVEKFGDDAAEQARDNLELCIGVDNGEKQK